ncbi:MULTISPECIES: hypothetical protein [Spirosoma]|uniref:Uncharacterized protein n=1 Tax=Spirosoma liriopis TaxID=2937440 RepID=A0ABT0HTI3_9BACT|nr:MULTISPECIES: hypothetical protein [Spirosoma]MCK8495494.1 hypothetical protein [Spirosoma liriopis]UHG94506.1 hypothetical protein LQ777_28370 [Spirosoma oryzicola]
MGKPGWSNLTVRFDRIAAFRSVNPIKLEFIILLNRIKQNGCMNEDVGLVSQN